MLVTNFCILMIVPILARRLRNDILAVGKVTPELLKTSRQYLFIIVCYCVSAVFASFAFWSILNLSLSLVASIFAVYTMGSLSKNKIFYAEEAGNKVASELRRRIKNIGIVIEIVVLIGIVNVSIQFLWAFSHGYFKFSNYFYDSFSGHFSINQFFQTWHW